jgi:hypothetical protein
MLSRIGGRDVKEAVRNCLYHLFDKDLAIQFSYCGRKGKRPFDKLEIKRVLLDAILRTSGCSSATETSVKEAAMPWFKYSKDQKGGRQNIKEKRPGVSATNKIGEETSSSESDSHSSGDDDNE